MLPRQAGGELYGVVADVEWPAGVRVLVDADTDERRMSSELGGVLQQWHVGHEMGAICVQRTEVGP